MLNPRLFVLSLLMCLSATPVLQAQDVSDFRPSQADASKPAESQDSYVLTLTLKITDHGKITTDQVYTLTAVNAGKTIGGAFNNASVRDGDKVPVVTGGEGDKTQVQYIDLGTNIDIESLQKMGSTLAMKIKIENSAALPNTTPKDDPVIRQTRYSISPAVTIGKLSTVYTSTDAVDGHKVEILLLAKPLDTK